MLIANQSVHLNSKRAKIAAADYITTAAAKAPKKRRRCAYTNE